MCNFISMCPSNEFYKWNAELDSSSIDYLNAQVVFSENQASPVSV